MSPEVEPKHAQLTRFLCQELLYEYVSGTLDRRRRQDVENYLTGCHDSQRELANLKKGLAYAQDVTFIQVSPSLHQALLAFEPAWKKRLQAWTLWSSQRGWRLLPAVFLTAVVALGLAVTKPWKTDLRPDNVLVVQKQSEPLPTEGVPSQAPSASLLRADNFGGVAPTAAPSLVVEPKAVAPFAAATVAAANTAKATTAAKAAIPEAAKTTTVAANADESDDDQATETSNDEATASSKDNAASSEPVAGRGSGVLYRGELRVTQFPSRWPAVRDKIEALDGKAAGSVELGWLRHADESYFHFTLPESNYPDLEAFLKTFGPVRIVKERHPRVMPKGQIRIILTVKDGESHENPAEAP